MLGNTAAINAVISQPINLGDNIWRFPVTNLTDGTLDVNLASDYGDIIDVNGFSLWPRPTKWNYEVFVLTPILYEESEVTLGTNNLISWDEVNNAETYYAQCSNEPNFTSIWNSSSWIYDNSFDFNNLILGQTYWYRVKAKTSPETFLWNQTTIDEFSLNTLDNIDVQNVPGDACLLFLPDVVATDTVGGTSSSWNLSGKFFNGNFFDCGQDCTLKKIEQYIGSSSYQRIYFLVYEASPGRSRYYRIYSKSIRRSGTRWYSSGSISVPLKKSYRYCIGIYTSSDIKSYFAWTGNQEISWGYKVADVSFSASSIPDSIKFNPSNYAFRQSLTVDIKRNYYEPYGTMLSTLLVPPTSEWNMIDFNSTVPEGTNLTIDVLDASDDSIIVADANDGEDLSWIDVNSIKLRANLSTDDPNVTPALHDWSVTYTDPTTIIESHWSNVVWSMQGTLGDAVDVMLEPDSMKNSNMKNALIAKIDAALGMIEAGKYNSALAKLENDILQKTDGCANIGEPDKNDWIITCEQQQEIYPLIIETIDYVLSLI